jgi:tetratricopeptide (TPR) repeat protein
MDDNGPRDEKDKLGLTATVLRCTKHPSQQKAADRLGVSRKRVSEIESRDGASRERLEEFAKGLGFRPIHTLKTIHLLHFLEEEEPRPVDPLGPSPEQEVAIYEAGREAAIRFETVMRDDCRRKNLEEARLIAAGQWERLQEIEPSRRQAEIRKSPDLRTWAFCDFLCAESVRQAVRDPRNAIHVGRLAVAAARCDLPWAGRLVAHALAHLANTYRVASAHEKSERLFALAHWLRDSSPADPGLLDPGRLHYMEAALRKDQRKLPDALVLLDHAYKIGRDRGHVLVQRALVLSLMGSYEEAIANLRLAETLLIDREPRDEAVLKYNLGVNLCHLNRFDEAAELAEAAYAINETSGNRIDLLRSFWLQARVLAGRGDRQIALGIYRILHRDFAELGMTYDLALVTLEFATVLLSIGRTGDCRSLAAGLASYFETKGIHKEALAAIHLLVESLELETATESLARQAIAFLYLARGNQDLHFVPVRS